MFSSIHSVGNSLEAALWLVVAGMLLVAGCRRAPRRQIYWLASATFVAFGFSDVVEVQTGAFWRPWWLLVWKLACIVLLILLWRKHRAAGTPG